MSASLPYDTIMVVGVNTRPIVKSVKALGLKAVAVDCFGDVDLHADAIFCTKSEPKNPEEGAFLRLSRVALETHEIDAILLTSGTEHDPRLIKELGKKARIIGNRCVNRIRTCVNKGKLFRVADRLGIPHPITYRTQTEDEALGAADEIGYPVVLKPAFGGGGIGIELVKSPEELESAFKKVLWASDGESPYVQEYIQGVNASASVLSGNDGARCLTVNEQLIGERRLGAPRRFGYCGNVIPLNKPEFGDEIAEYSEALCEEIGLVGSNGADFVLSDRPYLMEINPRFQNTIDCVEGLLGINLVEEHIRACEGELGEYGRAKGYAAKLILYTKWDTKVPDLGRFGDVVDIPPKGSIVERGRPLCSVLKFGSSRRGVLADALKTAEKIHSCTKQAKIEVGEHARNTRC